MTSKKQEFIYILFQIHVYLYIVYEYAFTTNGVSNLIVIGAGIYSAHIIALYLFSRKSGMKYKLVISYIKYGLLTCAVLLAILIAFDIYFYTGGGIFEITR